MPRESSQDVLARHSGHVYVRGGWSKKGVLEAWMDAWKGGPLDVGGDGGVVWWRGRSSLPTPTQTA